MLVSLSTFNFKAKTSMKQIELDNICGKKMATGASTNFQLQVFIF